MNKESILVDEENESSNKEKVNSFLTKERKESIRNELYSMLDDSYYELETYAADYIEEMAARKAINFLNKILKGDEESAKLLFECGDSSRYKQLGNEKGESWSRLIHGSIFTTQSVSLRDKLVEEYSELLKNERIKDLESIVDGLKKQINDLTKERESRWH